MPPPGAEEPLGVKFPGVTSAGPGQANWVGYLCQAYTTAKLVVYDYAMPESRADGIEEQVRQLFTDDNVQNNNSPWAASDSLFVTWAGRDDVAETTIDIEECLNSVMEAQKKMHESGARNFLFINLPPLPKPGSQESYTPPAWSDHQKRCTDWNSALSRHVDAFASSHNDAAVVIFDIHALVTRIMGNPTQYGFPADAGRMHDGAVYTDAVHPTAAVHEIIASKIADFLQGKTGTSTSYDLADQPLTVFGASDVAQAPPTAGRIKQDMADWAKMKLGRFVGLC
ncbi:hypothetical protein FRB99_004832 [Tulasnella sp. 403]|nr:hypothetical protein FRB99_004832 [Tulasnella sp. 403]